MKIGAEPIAGRFRLEGLVGAGGMGTVYRAHDLETGNDVALKLLIAKGPSELERFARESRMLSEMRHPHVVRWVAQGTTAEGEPFLAMEWLDGEDLSKRLERQALTTRESVQLALHVGDALAAAHELGVVHRDIKPANIFLPARAIDDVRVLDFGIARSSRDAGMTRTGAVLGTIGYMAPEQLRGERDLDGRADVFALGCVLFECLTTKPAFEGAHAMAVVTKILLEDAPRVRELDPALPIALDDLVARMLTRDRTKRITCAEAVAILRRFAVDSLPSPSMTTRAALTGSEQRVVSVIIAGAALADPTSAADQATLTPEHLSPLRTALHAAVEPFGASLELPGESMVIALLSGAGTPGEQAARAAGCALAMRPLLTDAPMALVTGLCVVSGRLPLGPIVDRAFAELRNAPRSGVGIDELTGALIMDRFEVSKTDHGLVLQRARATIDDVRTLLGQRTPYVGRERELGTLNAVLDESIADSVSRVVVVTAPPGMGKSRLVNEMLRGARQRVHGLQWLIGHGDSMARGAAFGLLGRAIRGAAGVVEGDPIETKRARLAELVGRRLRPDERRSVVSFVGELAGVPFDDVDDVVLRTARTDPALMNDRLQTAWIRWLEVECAAAPLLLVLEDLHWADAPTIRYVDRALDLLSDHPLMVLASARPEVSETFPGLWKARAITELSLAGLSKRAAERLVRTVLGEKVDGAEVARIVERSDGNAFFLEELLRCAAEGRTDTLPTSMIGMVNMRLADLDSETRRSLRAASIVGETFWAGAVAHLTDERHVQVVARIDDLVARELVSRRATSAFPGDRELAFRHALVREVAYATLTDEDKRLGHRLAGEWLESAGAHDPSMLAAHFERGGDTARAAQYYERAGDAALDVNDLDGAIASVERGLLCKPGPEVETALRFVAGRAYRWKGDLANAGAELRRVFEALPPGTRSWFQAGADLVNVIARRGLLDQASDVTGTLLATPCASDGDGVVRTRALARAACVIAYPHHLPNAAAALRAAQEQARVSDVTDPSAIGQLRAAEWSYAMATGAFAEALQATRRAAAAFESTGDLRTLAVEQFSELVSLCELGLFDEVIARAPGDIERAASFGLQFSVALQRMCLGRALFETGDYARAKSELEAAADWLAGRTPIEWWARAYLSHVAHAVGAREDALRHAERAVECAAELVFGLPVSLASLALAKLLAADVDGAVEVADRALDLATSAACLPPGDALVRRAYVEAHERAGHTELASRQLIVASSAVRERAARIEDPTWRAAFLAIPNHRFILERASPRGL